MKKYLLLLLLPNFIFAEVLDCKVEQVSRLYKDGTLGKHHLFEPFMEIDAQKHFTVNTKTGEVTGIILKNDKISILGCAVKVTGGGDDDTVITSNCKGQVEHIRISTWEINKPFIAVDFIRGVYSGVCK
jgi:hypothetical protein